MTKEAHWYQEGWEKGHGQGAGSPKERPDAAGSVPGRYAGVPSDGRVTPEKLFGHLKTVTMHRMLVAQGCFQVGLYWQGLTHDLSKFSPVEFWNSVRYY